MTAKMKEFKERMKNNQKNENYDYDKCRKFFDELSNELKDDYVVVKSCNADLSAYLVPKGTEHEISYYGKPEKSFRVSDHWNWYSNLKRCEKIDEVQCHSLDVNGLNQRDPEHPEMATSAIQVSQVAYYSPEDHKYHAVYGRKWNPEKSEYDWIDVNIGEALNKCVTI